MMHRARAYGTPNVLFACWPGAPSIALRGTRACSARRSARSRSKANLYRSGSIEGYTEVGQHRKGDEVDAQRDWIPGRRADPTARPQYIFARLSG
jgi:hypothetical protein